MSFFYDNLFERGDYPEGFPSEDIKQALAEFAAVYNPDDDNTTWFARLKVIAGDMGYAPEMKLWKQSPESYRGNVGDISMFIRVAITGRQNSPDLHYVMRILGEERVRERLASAIAAL